MARTEQIALPEGLLTSATLKGVQFCLFAEGILRESISDAFRGRCLVRVYTLLLIVL